MTDTATATSTDLIQLTAEVVASYVANNTIQPEALPGLIAGAHAAFVRLGADEETAIEAPTPGLSRAQIKKSITPDALISFEDGKPYKSLKRHLTSRGLTPVEYRQKHSLPDDYPMVAANYSAQRSALARALGLGQKSGKKRGRRKKA